MYQLVMVLVVLVEEIKLLFRIIKDNNIVKINLYKIINHKDIVIVIIQITTIIIIIKLRNNKNNLSQKLNYQQLIKHHHINSNPITITSNNPPIPLHIPK